MDEGNEGNKDDAWEEPVSLPALEPEPSSEQSASTSLADSSLPPSGSSSAPFGPGWVGTESSAEPAVPGEQLSGVPAEPFGAVPGDTTLLLPARPHRRKRALLLGSLAIAVVIIAAAAAYGLGGSSPRHAGSSTSLAPTSSTSGSTLPLKTTSQISHLLLPAVVDINTINQTDTGYALSAATGMIVSSDGYIVTNNHVVEEATSIKVTIAGHRGQVPARFVGADPVDDIAVIKVVGMSGLPTVRFGNSAAATVDSRVVAIGNALGRGGTPTVTTGTISALDRSISASDELSSTPEQLSGLIETSALIRPGNSGGPLVDDHAQVIGMNTAADPSGTSGFALPINRVSAIARAIEAGRSGDGVVLGLRAFLGVVGQPPKAGAAHLGVPITRVVLGDPAARAGVEPGDTIIEFDGKSTPTVSVLKALVTADRPGARATVTFEGPAGVRTVTLRLIVGPAP
jgi:S1-C subfamily serine protease